MESTPAERPPPRLEVRHAQHFDIEYHDGYQVVRTRGEVTGFQSTDEAELVEDVVVLVPREGPRPLLPAGLRNAPVIATPVGSFAVNNDNLLALTAELGLKERLVAVGGLYTFDDSIRAQVARGDLGKIQYSWHLPPDIEVLLTREPDVTFMAMDSPHNVPALGRTRELGLAIAPTFVWAERDVLARAEWIKFFAAFFGLEKEATEAFGEIEKRMADLKVKVATVVDTPTVLWGYHAGNGRWFMAVNNLEARLLRDAGVKNPLENLNGPWRFEGAEYSNESLLLEGANAEHWIIGDIHADALPPAGFMAEFRAWREDRLYHNYARAKWDLNAYDWYEGAVARPDVALADLIRLFHPHLLPRHELVYLGRYDRENGGPTAR